MLYWFVVKNMIFDIIQKEKRGQVTSSTLFEVSANT